MMPDPDPMSRFSFSLPHSGHFRSAFSVIDWNRSKAWLHDPQT